MLSNQSKLSVYNVTIATVNYPIITSDSLVFETTYNRTNRNLASLLSLNCLIDNYSGGVSYSDMIVTNSSGWIFYLISCLFSFIIIVGLKGWQTYAYDIVKAIYNKDHGKYDYNISNYIIFNLLFANLVYGHYYFYNLIFTGQYSPCIGVNYWYGSTDSLLHDKNKVHL